MRTKVHKSCAILLLALLPAAAGCTILHPDPSNPNPICPQSSNERFPGKPVPYCAILALDPKGLPYPDLHREKLDATRLARSHYSLEEYFQGDPSYDPDQIFDEFARNLTALCGRDRTLVVLIHGFNATMPENRRAYKAARRQIEFCYPGRKFAYLEVYWDGLYGDPLPIWHIAQRNSKWAGLGLRKLLCRLPASLPVRVITHSRGAAVICAALWNVDLSSASEEDADYREAQKKLLPPELPSLRVGLLAPAMRAGEFETYTHRGEGNFYIHDRIVLGINPDDHALNCGGFWWAMGTELGCSPDLVDSIVSPPLNRGRAHAFRVDFSGSVEHAFEDYVLRDVFEDEFLPLLFGEDRDRSFTARSR